jgi:diguanylate cyclase (GGDEF)-like protein/PAS domain S-box-containing protein
VFEDLFASFAVVALFVAAWALSQEWIRSWPRTVRMVGAGVYMGFAAVTAMVMAVPFGEGILFDLRTVLLGLAGLFAGPVAALIAGLLAAAYRLWLGGAGAQAGVISIIIGCLSGWLAFLVRTRLGSWRAALAAFTGIQSLLPLAIFAMLPATVRLDAFVPAILPLIGLNLFASLLAATGIEISRRRGRYTHLLRAAIRQSPDYFYIKDKKSRFVIANGGVLAATGVSDIEELVGRTDFDFETPERAERHYADEREVLRSGLPMVDREETIQLEGRPPRSFVTTKTPIRNADGSIAGLVGVTRDLTDRLQLEHALRSTKSELDTIMQGMSDGLARFDADNRLVFVNANYQNLFPLTGRARQPGAALGDILDAVIRSGEQLLGTLDPGVWKRSILAHTITGGEEQVQMADGRWLLIRTQPLDVGGAVVIVSDVTTLKRAETQLAGVAEQFRVLATTDPLTGLHNRRDFDQVLEREFLRARKSEAPIGLLLADIDHFKAFNDTYGHPAGDACLRQIAACIGAASRRADDMAARYGGEEFAIILPRTDAVRAALVAAAILDAVERLAIPHRASASGLVSLSIGIATREAHNHDDVASLLKAADIALYKAKRAGRGRVVLAA